MSHKKMNSVYRWAAILSLLCGTAIYAFFRNTGNMLLFRFISKPGFLDALRFSVNADNYAVSVFVFQGPDILWFLTGLFFIRSMWLSKKEWMRMYIIVFSVIAMVYELAQISPYVPGTFDIKDILFLCITAFIESVIYHFCARGELNEKKDHEAPGYIISNNGAGYSRCFKRNHAE